MTRLARFWRFFLTVLVALVCILGGVVLETRLFEVVAQAPLTGIAPMAVFFGIVNLNVLLLALCVFLVMRAAVKLAIDRKKGAFGSSLRTKLVTSFVAFAVLPTVVLLYTTARFVDSNIEKWLPASLVETSRKSALSERAYLDFALRALDALDLSTLRKDQQTPIVDFVYDLDQSEFWPGLAVAAGEPLTQRIRAALPRLKERGSAVWIDGASADERPLALRRIARATVVGIEGPYPIHPGWQRAEREFGAEGTGISLLRLSFYSMLAVLSLLIVFAATWLGFTIAREMSGPLLALSRAAERVAHGDYAVEIDEFVSDDEMGVLAQSFRSMVGDLRGAHDKAVAAAQEIAVKARALERNSAYNGLLVTHVHSGIIAATGEGVIMTWNRKVEMLFGVDQSSALGKLLRDVLDPDFYAAIVAEELVGSQPGEPQGVRDVASNTRHFRGVIEGRERTLHITIIRQPGLGELVPAGHASGMAPDPEAPDLLILIEDVTELERAQRVAAWRDVARRVAHEIKNPLTPISLGIQRIQRRFLPRLEGKDLEVFLESARIITDSTESIRRLVEEFNRFARMPQALLRPGHLLEAVELALAGFAGADQSSVRLRVMEASRVGDGVQDIPQASWSEYGRVHPATFDKDQIVRLLSNLVSNAIEACDGRTDLVAVDVLYAAAEGRCYLTVRDEGPGIPKNLRSLIFEPYFSTRRKGSGLGLPIVRQIVTEHSGDISVFDNHPRGSIFKVALPILGGGGAAGSAAAESGSKEFREALPGRVPSPALDD